MSERKLQITQVSNGAGQYSAKLVLEGEGLAQQTATSTFEFKLEPQHREDVRWYLEDYLQYPQDPAPTIAARIEGDLKNIGVDLFKKVFQPNDDTRDLWATLRQKLDDTRVEVNTSVTEANSIPWELIRDPKTDAALALRAESFVRSHSQAAQQPELPQTESGAIRILLVICRPSGDDDVPFRSVATQLIKGLGDQAEDSFQLDVLRPATFERLARVLRDAKSKGKPYHVVHFDGHGMYSEVPDTDAAINWLQRLIPVVLSGPRTGRHGYLLFEKPDHDSNMELVDGPTLGKLLVAADVALLVLNACRSAHAEAPSEPEKSGGGSDVHEQVRAFGSLAQEVMDAGVAGVVAMRYNVYVVTAAQFVADMYQTLVQGRSLGESVSMGRKQLAAQPNRTISFDPRPLQDWPVPIVYEAAPIELFPKRADDRPQITIRGGRSAIERGALDNKLPRPPDIGFFGRDETLLALDRAFDEMPIVLLHAYAGSGKTSTAAEFARWYSLTGGVLGPVLFTSFETYTPLPRVFDKIGEVFDPILEQQKIHWLTLDNDTRRDIALQILKQYPVLWIWDNVEPIAGLADADNAYTPDERQALVDFLRDAKQTQAKILLTSRRDEREWLGDLPCRIAVPRMPMQERVQLARALAEHHQRRLTDVDDWRPLLRFTQGNPLTITVLVGQALRDGLHTRDQIEMFVDRLRTGEAAFDDEAEQGRTRSLGASLQYGFEHAFTEDERRILALLAMFQGFVDVDVLRAMGEPKVEWNLPELKGATRESLIALLDRAAEVGLLTSHGAGYYVIHPALPWFFYDLLNKYRRHDGNSSQNSNNNLHPFRAFVEAMGALGNHYHREFNEGNQKVIDGLSAEEANLLHARHLAQKHDWWFCVTSAMQGLQALYSHTGRRAEWRRLVEEIIPQFVDLPGDGPVEGLEDDWSLVTQYRVRLARDARQWDEAERIQTAHVEWTRKRAENTAGVKFSATANPEDYSSLKELKGVPRNTVRWLAVSLHELGDIQRERLQPDCVASYKESLVVVEAINDRVGAAKCTFNLGTAYKNLKNIRDFAQAEHWYQRSLDLRDEQDLHGRARCLGQIGGVAFARFKEGLRQKLPEAELLEHLNAALQSYHDVLNLMPADAVNDLAVVHSQMGLIYGAAGRFDQGVDHFRRAIVYNERTGNIFDASRNRMDVAIQLAQSNRLLDAREYARAAHRGFETYGESAAEVVARTQQLIVDIEQAIEEQQL